MDSATVQRPQVKRARYTWPMRASSRSHFEDFLREIGEPAPAHHLCCVPRQPQKHATRHHSSEHRARASSSAPIIAPAPRKMPNHSSKNMDPGALQSSSREIKASAPIVTSAVARKASRSPVTSANKVVGFPDVLKTRPLSVVDICHHDAKESHSILTSASLSLRRLLGYPPADEHSPPPVEQLDDVQGSQSRTERSLSPADTARSRTSRGRSSSPSLRRSSSSDSLATASSSEAPATPRANSPLLPSLSTPLADLEHTSRFRVRVACATCKKTGSNFPSCAKCGEAWCSRDCRTKGSNGRRHVCRGNTV